MKNDTRGDTQGYRLSVFSQTQDTINSPSGFGLSTHLNQSKLVVEQYLTLSPSRLKYILPLINGDFAVRQPCLFFRKSLCDLLPFIISDFKTFAVDCPPCRVAGRAGMGYTLNFVTKPSLWGFEHIRIHPATSVVILSVVFTASTPSLKFQKRGEYSASSAAISLYFFD